jgi:hypothetical protein
VFDFTFHQHAQGVRAALSKASVRFVSWVQFFRVSSESFQVRVGAARRNRTLCQCSVYIIIVSSAQCV